MRSTVYLGPTNQPFILLELFSIETLNFDSIWVRQMAECMDEWIRVQSPKNVSWITHKSCEMIFAYEGLTNT